MNLNDSGATPTQENPWNSLGLHSDLLSLVQKAGFEQPTPVQAKSIPLALEGKDLMVSAQTGTGKTAAFCFPMIEKLRGREGTYGLVLAPSREIALQTQAVLDQFGLPLGIRSAVLIGGIDIRHDEKALATYPQILVATPGRLCDHLDRGNIWLSYLEFVVLDEADRMLDMGFSDQLNRILQDTPSTRQTLLFSATIPDPVAKLAHKILQNPERVQIGKPVSAAKTVDQHFIFTDEALKMRELQKIIREEPGTIFIFTRSKDGASRLWRSLRSRGFYDATHLHSDLRQCDREQSLEDFKAGKYRVMIATDVIGRGIHVDGVAHVVNYDLPRDASDYVHRIGRTGRADATGKATSFVTPRDKLVLGQIERLLGETIGGQSTPAPTPANGARAPHRGHASPRPPSAQDGPRRKRRGGRGGKPASGTRPQTEAKPQASGPSPIRPVDRKPE